MATEAKTSAKPAPKKAPAPASVKKAPAAKDIVVKVKKNKFAETMKFIYFIVPVFLGALMTILLFTPSKFGLPTKPPDVTRAIWGINYAIIGIVWIEMIIYKMICKKVNYVGGSIYYTGFLILLHLMTIVFISLDFADKGKNLAMSTIYFMFVPYLSAFWFVFKHPVHQQK